MDDDGGDDDRMKFTEDDNGDGDENDELRLVQCTNEGKLQSRWWTTRIQ